MKRLALFVLVTTGCMSPLPDGLLPAQPADTTVKFDFFAEPLPEIPLPNDIATRADPSAATGRRVNASQVAPTRFESRIRRLIDTLDGWGVFQPISVPFTGALDIGSILAGHRDLDYDLTNDVIYLINVDPRSRDFGEATPLDVGNGNYPVAVEDVNAYWLNDPRAGNISLTFEEADEDINGNGVLDLGEDKNGNGTLDPGEDNNGNSVLDLPEDSDGDGLLDLPNYLPGATPAWSDLAARADALMTFYERQTHTLIVRPMVPLHERTTYAVVVTRRLLDAAGKPVGSPFPFINHTAQTQALTPLLDVLPEGLALDDIAFAFTFTTQTVQAHLVAVRDGLYGHGVQAHLGRDFPPEIDTLETLLDAEAFPAGTALTVMPAGVFYAALQAVEPADPTSAETQALADAAPAIDFFVIGSFLSPQLFPREDADGHWLPLDEQSWPPDLDRKAAPARAERVYFTLAVPRKDISARRWGLPVPVVLVGHGYASSRIEGMVNAPYMCRRGLAVLSIDGPSHGIGFDIFTRAAAENTMRDYGLAAAARAIFKDRAHNQDDDPFDTPDSGADFWTSYLFHTRDMVRQFILDYMQTVRVVKSFDGARRWRFDVNGDGTPDLAGDFDGDGAVDIGKTSRFSMVGGSLGGIMAMLVGSLEPQVTAVAPIAGGGGYSDMGVRTMQGGAVQGFVLRAMAPMFTGTLDALPQGNLTLATVVTNLNDDATLDFAVVPDVRTWDTLVVENLTSGERGCGYVNAEGRVRAHLATDEGDPLRVRVYAGPQLTGEPGCELRAGATLRAQVTEFGLEVVYQQSLFYIGDHLVALADGLGMPRGHPDFRRLLSLGQLVLDLGDPAAYARNLGLEPVRYPGTGERTGAHALVLTSVGDMNVPAGSGVTYGRAAGLIDYKNADPRYGKPLNQVLIDTYMVEAVHLYKRYMDPAGNGVHIDVENFASGGDMFGTNIPRLNPPLRIGMGELDPLGGYSAALFPYPEPRGRHGFDFPGGMTERARDKCRAECAVVGPPDPCGCDALQTFDLGYFMINMIATYFVSDGAELSADLCQSSDDCQ